MTMPKIFFFLLTAILLHTVADAQLPEDVFRGEKNTYNLTLFESVVNRRPATVSFYEKSRARHPKADLIKFPIGFFEIDTTKIKPLFEGDRIQDEVLDMPLWVVNDAYGRDTITLRKEIEKKWLILDIWEEHCGPCIHSMNKWEQLLKQPDANFQLIGLYSSFYPHRAAFETRRKGFQSVQVIGEAAAILSRIFLGANPSLGPSVWIKDGKLFGISQAMTLKEEDYTGILNGQIKAIPSYAIPDYARWKFDTVHKKN